MSTITKEQLIERLQHIISVASGFPESEKAQIDLELARIALASLEAEPVAYIFKHPAGKLFWALTDESNKDQSDVIPVYATPPVPVVPEEKPMPNPLKMYAVDAVAAIAEVRGWNACRAAMLQSQGNCIKDGWISCSDRMPEDTKMLLAFSQGEIVAAYWNWVVNPIDYKKYRAFTYLSGNILDDVTHWMPLPEPPL
ncbi:DUF551 domain-containing protein [Escherichia coli]|uniref:DUF551 domain-containing protein n=1 Tax=Escherichia coli TaxID=562 RepID=UPI000F60421D|nr:DUF551 domain-containing protein [Escherichia coli]RRC13101.1 DUF551 domain-containing protein [Escherichia coli]